MKRKKKSHTIKYSVIAVIALVTVVFGIGSYYSVSKTKVKDDPIDPSKVAVVDELFGWKFPITTFPITGSDGKLIAYSNIRDPGGVPRGLPVRLKIPSIGVNSAIEDALITPDGRMDVPIGSVNVAWFSLGTKPGEKGSAVIGGHYGISDGKPWVFYKLNTMKSGEKIYIENDKGDTLAFIVKRTQSFDRNGDSSSVFTSSDGIAHLNLITCEGTWNQVNGSYPQRFVVFADAIVGEGPVQVQERAKATLKPTAKATAVPTIEPTATATVVPTPTPEDVQATQAPTVVATTSATNGNVVHSLYATPINAVITSSLLISIVSLAIKVLLP